MFSKKWTKLKYTFFASRIGMLGFVATDNGICRLDLNVDPSFFGNELENRYHCRAVEDDTFFSRMKEDLHGYFDGSVRRFNSSIDFIEGTDFQRKVWMTLMKMELHENAYPVHLLDAAKIVTVL